MDALVLTFVAMPSALALVALAAAWDSARRVAQADRAIALRAE